MKGRDLSPNCSLRGGGGVEDDKESNLPMIMNINGSHIEIDNQTNAGGELSTPIASETAHKMSTLGGLIGLSKKQLMFNRQLSTQYEM